MERLIKDHLGLFSIIFVLSLGLSVALNAGATATEFSLSEVDQATYSADTTALGKIYESTEGRIKYVAGYRLITLKLFIEKDVDGGKKILGELVADLEASLQQTRNNGEAWAVLASLRGLQIVTAPEFASVYGPKIGLEMALAMDYGKNHPVVYLLQALSLYNTPEQYGGSKTRALELLNRAIELYAQAKDEEHWGLMDAYAWRGQAHQALGHPAEARADYQAALGLQPQSTWVKSLLASVN